jgi:amino acid adenylation domain-containing protein
LQIDSIEEGLVLPASYAQQRMWFLQQLEGGAAYNVPIASLLRGGLDLAAFKEALDALVRRHETLRTVFTVIEGVPHQLIRPSERFVLDVVDVSQDDAPEAHAFELASRQARTPFDLAQDAPFRALLIVIGPDEHLLALTVHHVVADAWSTRILNRELVELYTAEREGRAPRLPELPIQYSDYAAWQQQWLDQGGLDHQLVYWTEHLAGAPSLLELPTDRPRPPRQSFRGATTRTLLPLQLAERVRSLGETENATLFMTLLAVFGVLLSRLSGQDELVVATPVANRSRTELEHVIGLFVNTLPLRLRLDHDPSFRELLREAREVVLGGFTHQDLPFEKLVEQLSPERRVNHAPIAQVMFVVQSATDQGATFPGLEVEPIRTERGTAKFDLTFFATEVPGGLRLSVEYCSDLFDESTAQRFLDQFRALLESTLADPDCPVSRLGLLRPDERRDLLEELAGQGAVFPVTCLHTRFEEEAARAPSRPAVVYEGAALSYGELNERANRLAHVLRTNGVERETLVALCLERSLDLVVAILAVLKAGGAYVPLDPDYPTDRLAFTLDDTAAPVLLTQEHLLERLPPHQARVVCLDRDAALIAASPAENPRVDMSPEDAAYVIYTSGSTGRPKGVTVEHRNVARLFTATDAWFSFRPDDTWTLLHSYAFDFSVWELWGALLYGGRLVVVPAATTRSPSALSDLLVAEEVTVLNSTPSLFLTALEDLLHVGERLALRVVVFGGEALQPAALAPWFTRFGEHGPQLVNMYGITETTVHVTYRPIGPRDVLREVSPIGEPIPDLRTYVLDRHLEPVPEGVPGELYIGGSGVARGYLNRPELTAEKFVANPFGDGRLYRTGDRARRVGGELLYLGRTDHQVKIRGFRIELGEVESALRDHPEVRDAIVLAREDAGGDRRLVAYVLAHRPAPEAATLRDVLAMRLPNYMLPSAVMFLDAFPLTPNGKIDRATLLALPLTAQTGPGSRTAPRTETERAVAAIWQKLLSLEEIGADDDFFELGGHSLMAVRLMSEIERRFRVRLPLSALFATATIAGLSTLIDRERIEETTSSPLVSLRTGRAGEPPLYLVAWAGGEVLPYRNLVEKLDPDIPVVGLRAPGTDRRTSPLGSVEELADFYVGAITRAQPHGPYRLGGYCFSGIVAYEIARRLQERGEVIAALLLFDAYPFKPRPRPSALVRARTQLGAFRAADRGGRRRWSRERVRALAGRLNRAVYVTQGPRVYEWLRERNLEHVLPRRPWNLVLIASNRARWRYLPTPLDIRLDFFRAQTAEDSRPTPWDGYATGGVVLHPIIDDDINHERMMQPSHAAMLADALAQSLRPDPEEMRAVAGPDWRARRKT